MSSGSNFDVHVPSGFSSQDMSNLSESEKSLAKARGLSEEEFRRSKSEYLAREERARSRGRDLGELVQALLAELGSSYRLTHVSWNTDTLSWTLEVETPSGPTHVVVSWELADDVLDARTKNELQRLRNIVLFGIGRQDLIGRARR